MLSFLPESGKAQDFTLPTLYVRAQQTANIFPVSTYQTLISNLEFEPRIDLQSRNMAEAQGDVSIRGGIFENTGFRIGSATLIDPQTGHYFTEIPIATFVLHSVGMQLDRDFFMSSLMGLLNQTAFFLNRKPGV